MKNFKKILPAVALAGAGIVAVAGAGNASAYNYAMQYGSNEADPRDVAICYTLSNITLPISNLTYTTTLSTTSGVNLNNVSKVDSSSTEYGYNTSSHVVSINFSGVDGTQSSVTKCAHLNFSSAIPSSSAFGEYIVNLSATTATPNTYPADSSTNKTLKLAYFLDVDNNGDPKQNNSNVYQSYYYVKSLPSFSSSMTADYGHVEVTKKVRGNEANPDAEFVFTATVTKKYNSITGLDPANNIDYEIYVQGANDPIECRFGTACTFRLKHGQKAYIGCEDANCANDGHLVKNGVAYTITETDAKNHTPYVDGNAVSTNTTGAIDLTVDNKAHEFVNEKKNTLAGRFFNIIPFIILAALATVGVVVLRKANKKNEA